MSIKIKLKRNNKLVRGINKQMRTAKRNRYRRLIAFCLIGGIIVSGVFAIKNLYSNFYLSSAHLSFVFPEISLGKYPDGTRFSSYDLINKDRVGEALESLQEQGIYTQYEPEDLLEHINVYNYLEKSMQTTVNYMRTQGSDYSYYGSEYEIFFAQPLKFSITSPQSLFGLLEGDHSEEFLEELMKKNAEFIKENHAGGNGFRNLVTVEEMSDYDYSEKVAVYDSKLNFALNYLTAQNTDSNGFVSPKNNLGFFDLKNAFQVLRDEKLNQLSSFINSSHLTSNINLLSNKMKIAIESNTTEYLKKSDEMQINKYAQMNYDHTFTENLIVVSANEDNGLYQARPKTAYDTVVQQLLTAEGDAAEYSVAIREDNNDLYEYSLVTTTTDEYARLCDKAETLITEFDKEYHDLMNTASVTIDDYINHRNNDIFSKDINHISLINSSFLMKLAIAFALGAGAALILYIIVGASAIRRIEKHREEVVKRVAEDKK